MPKWTYGDAYQRHPCADGIVQFDGGALSAARQYLMMIMILCAKLIWFLLIRRGTRGI